MRLNNLADPQRELLAADMQYLKADLKHSFWKSINMVKRNPISSILRKSNMFKAITDILYMFDEIGIFNYEITNAAKKTTVKLFFNELYFKNWEMIRSSVFGSKFALNLVDKGLTTKKGVKEMFEKEIKKNYTSDFIITESNEE